ncbi:MAG: cupin domain-containing protein [Solirubrobacteraceae bacterium]
MRHNHADDRVEDVYAVLNGTGTVIVDGRDVTAGPGQFIAVTPEAARHVRAGDSGLVLIAVCAARRE